MFFARADDDRQTSLPPFWITRARALEAHRLICWDGRLERPGRVENTPCAFPDLLPLASRVLRDKQQLQRLASDATEFDYWTQSWWHHKEAKNESKMGHDLAKGADRFEERSKISDGKSAEEKQKGDA